MQLHSFYYENIWLDILDIPTKSSTVTSFWTFLRIVLHLYFPASDSCTLEILSEVFPLYSSFMRRFVLYQKTGFFISWVSEPSRYRKAMFGARPSLAHSTVGKSSSTLVRQGRMTASPAEATIFADALSQEASPTYLKINTNHGDDSQIPIFFYC